MENSRVVRRQDEDDHICLKKPCYYCMVVQGKPLPAEILVGYRPPEPDIDPALARKWRQLSPSAQDLVRALIEKLGEPAGRPDAPDVAADRKTGPTSMVRKGPASWASPTRFSSKRARP